MAEIKTVKKRLLKRSRQPKNRLTKVAAKKRQTVKKGRHKLTDN